MPTELHPTADFHKAGYLYLLVCWGVFLSYCVLYQFDRFITLFLRWQRQRRRRYIKKRDDEISIQPPHEMINHWMRPLEHSRTIPYIATMISTKHLIGMSLFIIANIIFIWFSPFKLHPLQDHYEWPIVAILDRRMMYVGMANFSFTMVLGTRNSIITALCGLSFEQLIPFHRWCARLGLAETVLHVVYRAWDGYWANGRGSFHDAFFKDEEYTSGTISLIGYVILFATSFYYIRRHFFRLFYYWHIIGIVIATGGAMWHEWSCIYFLYPPTLLWVLDRLLRSYYSWWQQCDLVHVKQYHEKIVYANFKHPRLQHFRPGQYFFTAFLTTRSNDGKESKQWYHMIRDWIEQHADWYPMTVSNYQEKTLNASFHIKSLGDGTQRLMQAAKNDDSLHLRVDGPYGPRLPYMDYHTVALFAVGIGITPALTILKDCVQQMTRRSFVRKVYLIWSVTTADEVQPFIELLKESATYPPSSSSSVQVNMTIHLTREKNTSRCLDLTQHIPGCDIIQGCRPDIQQCLKNIAEKNEDNKHVWVHACGSISFMNTVINEAVSHGFDFHHETFEF